MLGPFLVSRFVSNIMKESIERIFYFQALFEYFFPLKQFKNSNMFENANMFDCLNKFKMIIFMYILWICYSIQSLIF